MFRAKKSIYGPAMIIRHNMYLRSKTKVITILVIFWSIVCLHPASSMPIVDAIRIGDYKNKTRFVMEMNKRVRFNVFTLGRPYRIVIELPKIKWKIKSSNLKKSRRIIGYRFGLYRHENSRFVIDLGRPIRVSKAFHLSPSGNRKHRIIIDLSDTSPADFFKNIKRGIPKTFNKTISQKNFKVKNKTLKKETPLIVLDPGHGGIDSGARGLRGTLEKKVVLALAYELKKQLVYNNKYRVLLTRTRDVFVRLRERIAIAHRAGADLFISLHADSIGKKHVRGGSVYTLSERASDREAEALARRENKSDIIAGVDLNEQSNTVAKILIDLRQRLTKNNSVMFAKLLGKQLNKKILMLRRNHRFAGFAVLKAPEIPSVLIEMGYLSNTHDEKLIRSPRHRRKIAKAIKIAIDKYFTIRKSMRRP
tara:strand:+ start:2608 stop:3870 length:1263 start_codon:yes stop_codon:yes gene_type:complete